MPFLGHVKVVGKTHYEDDDEDEYRPPYDGIEFPGDFETSRPVTPGEYNALVLHGEEIYPGARAELADWEGRMDAYSLAEAKANGYYVHEYENSAIPDFDALERENMPTLVQPDEGAPYETSANSLAYDSRPQLLKELEEWEGEHPLTPEQQALADEAEQYGIILKNQPDDDWNPVFDFYCAITQPAELKKAADQGYTDFTSEERKELKQFEKTLPDRLKKALAKMPYTRKPYEPIDFGD